MDDYFMMRRHVPAFGSWDSGQYLPFTECFESARQGTLQRYQDIGSGDLCVTGDLYKNIVVTPAMIVVPRSRSKSNRAAVDGKQKIIEKHSKWEPEHPIRAHCRNGQTIAPSAVRFGKPVDEDLYKISPEHLYSNAKKKSGLGFFARCCLVPT